MKGLIAGGTIYPARIVNMPGTPGTDYTVIQSTGAGAPGPYGVSSPADRYAPGTPFDANLGTGPGPVAYVGQEVFIAEMNDEAQIEAGAAITGGQRVMSNGNGQAIPWTSGNWFVGEALESCAASGTRINTKIVLGYA